MPILPDPNGNLLWAQESNINASNENISCDPVIDNSGNVYICTQGEWVSGIPRTKIYKFNSSGTLAWASSVDFTDTRPSILDLGPDDALYAVVQNKLKKINSASGVLEWSKNSYSPYSFNYKGGNLQFDSSNNIYLLSEKLVSGQYDAVLAKYDQNALNLNPVWERSFVSTAPSANDFGKKLLLHNNSLYVLGTTAGSFAGFTDSAFDLFLAKYDTDGNQAWFTQYTYSDPIAGGLKQPEMFALNNLLYVNGNGSKNFSGFTGAESARPHAYIMQIDTNTGNQDMVQQLGDTTSLRYYPQFFLGANNKITMTSQTAESPPKILILRLDAATLK